jgi:hypothetical protein
MIARVVVLVLGMAAGMTGCVQGYNPGPQTSDAGDYDPLTNFDFGHDPDYSGGATTGSPLEHNDDRLDPRY